MDPQTIRYLVWGGVALGAFLFLRSRWAIVVPKFKENLFTLHSIMESCVYFFMVGGVALLVIYSFFNVEMYPKLTSQDWKEIKQGK